MDRIWDLIWTTAPGGWHWLALAAVLGVLELLTPATVALWFALAALAVGLVLFVAPGLAFVFQALAFGLLALAGVLLWFGVVRPQAKRRPQEAEHLNERLATLIGRRGIVLAADPAGNLRVRVGDTSWPARSTAAGSMPVPGTAVDVVGTENTLLTVEPVRPAPDGG